MTCPRCQQENPPGSRFCLGCGSRLASRCASCGSDLPASARFCNQCGSAVAPTPPEGPFATPATYTPTHLAEKILTSKAALEGERKQVTVLFADLKGSMELLADRDAEEARKLLDPVLERMMEAVHRYEGTVNQVMGDGIMALFGAPVAHEDHAVRACYAALDLQRAMRRLTEQLRQSHGVTVQARVGLNSGEVVVRTISSDLRLDYTAVGQTTHLAARMEQLATPGATLLTADTLRLAEGYVEVKPLGAMPVKGLPAPVEAYELTGAGPRRSRLSATAARGLTRFVGRDAEIEQLRHALSRTARGPGQVVAIVGEPGVGKSRVVWEVTHSHRVQGWLVLQAGSVSYGTATAYLPVRDLLKHYFAIEDRDEPRELREKVTGKLLTLDRALEPALAPLLALLEVPVDDPGWTALDPRDRRQRTLEAIKQLLLRESQRQPLLLVFEDLHWIDAETQTLLDAVVESLPVARLLLLVNYRPEYRHGWGNRAAYTQLRLDPLPPESAEQLLTVLLGSDPTLAPLIRVLIERTEGNPFFLEESVRTLVETGALTGDPGAYGLTQPLPAVQVPATVQAVLAARLDRLSPGDKALLQAASVVGKDVPLALLQAIAGESEDALRGALGRLQVAEFLYEARLFPDLEYTFKHALTHEVTYRSLLQDRRRLLHGQIVGALERLYRPRIGEQVERLAHHALRGEVWEPAFRYLRDAAAKAITRSAYREAVGFWQEALRIVPHLPQDPPTLEHAIDIHFELRHALLQVEGPRSFLDHLREAERLALALGDQRRLGWVCDYLGNYHFLVGDYESAIQRLTRALTIAAEIGDVPLAVAATIHLGGTHYFRGDYRAAAAVLRRNMAALAELPRGERLGQAVPPSLLLRMWLALALGGLGEFTEGVRQADEALSLARETGRDLDLIYASLTAGVHLQRGDLERAIGLYERGVALSRKLGATLHDGAGPLGWAYVLSGRSPEAVRLLMDGLESAAAVGETSQLSRWTTYLGEAYLLTGRATEARDAGLRALQGARERGERANEAWALRLLGEIARRTAPRAAEHADSYYHDALTLASELGLRPLVAHCHLGLGELYRRTGDDAKAHEHLTTAVTMYREMGMTYWLEQAEAALGPPHVTSP